MKKIYRIETCGREIDFELTNGKQLFVSIFEIIEADSALDVKKEECLFEIDNIDEWIQVLTEIKKQRKQK